MSIRRKWVSTARVFAIALLVGGVEQAGVAASSPSSPSAVGFISASPVLSVIHTATAGSNELHKSQVAKLSNPNQKETTEVTLRIFMPGSSPVNYIESVQLHSESAEKAYGRSQGFRFGYSRLMQASDRQETGPNPYHAKYGGDSWMVDEQVYGRYGLLKLPEVVIAKDYTLHVSVPGFRPFSSSVSVTKDSPVLDVVLEPAVVYNGRVVNTDGSPVPDAKVWAVGATGHAYARTDLNGAYSLAGLGNTERLRLYAQASDYADYSEIQLVLKGKYQLEPVRLEKAKTMKGKVVDRNKRPLDQATVLANKGQHLSASRTNQDGSFVLDGLSAAYYDIFASRPGYPDTARSWSSDDGEVTLVLGEEEGIFSGEGNSLDVLAEQVIRGKEIEYQLTYRNISSREAEGVIWNILLPDKVQIVDHSLKLNGKPVAISDYAPQQVKVGAVSSGQGGKINFKLKVTDQFDEAVIRIEAYVLANGSVQKPKIVSTRAYYDVTLDAPSLTGSREIRVSGEAASGSTVAVYADATLIGYVRAQDGKWKADLELPVLAGGSERTFHLTAYPITERKQTSLKRMSPVAKVKYSTSIPVISNVSLITGDAKSDSIDWEGLGSDLTVVNGHSIRVKITLEEGIEKASLSFAGKSYELQKKDRYTFEGEIPSGWKVNTREPLVLNYEKKGKEAGLLPLLNIRGEKR